MIFWKFVKTSLNDTIKKQFYTNFNQTIVL
jgi:hypothetical protein